MTREGASILKDPHSQKALLIGALGVVYGDIGTSPLYAFKECFFGEGEGHHSMAATAPNVLGIVSLIFWSLTLVVVIKYLVFVLRANNHGEGGIMALMALVSPKTSTAPGEQTLPSDSAFPMEQEMPGAPHKPTRRPAGRWVLWAGLFGTALLYGDGMITPAISVLGALEGIAVVAPAFENLIVPITAVILIGLFMFQKHGTARVGRIFGPTMIVWFAALAAMGIPWIIQAPEVLLALSPLVAVDFFIDNGLHAFLILSSVVLCITGAEALYADMGHFGARPIRKAWYWIVFPALILNYLGQGALVLVRGSSQITNPFFEMVPSFLQYPMIALATLAAIIASQALISGAYSLTHQAIRLGFLPRIPIIHTSETTEGQIYVPKVNFILMICCLALVFAFRSSTSLAAAYGIAVTGTMAITSVLFYVVARRLWNWPRALAIPVVAVFLAIDLTFFAANTTKLIYGGWFPLAIGALIFLIMLTWKQGRAYLSQEMLSKSMPITAFIEKVAKDPPPRVPGTAIYMTTNINVAPRILLHHFKHNRVLHEQVVLLSVNTQHAPTVPFHEHGRSTDLGCGFYQVVANYGYMQIPNISEILACSRNIGVTPYDEHTSFFLGRETLLPTGKTGWFSWRKHLFMTLSRNAQPATAFFEIPAEQVMEVGIQLKI